MNRTAATIIIVFIILVERTFLGITISILRESPEFTVHLAYAILFDGLFTTLTVVLVLICIPWLGQLKLERINVVSLDERRAFQDDF